VIEFLLENGGGEIAKSTKSPSGHSIMHFLVMVPKDIELALYILFLRVITIFFTFSHIFKVFFLLLYINVDLNEGTLSSGETPLHVCVGENLPHIVQLLLLNGKSFLHKNTF